MSKKLSFIEKMCKENGTLRQYSAHKKLYKISNSEEKSIYHRMCMDQICRKKRNLNKTEKKKYFERAVKIAKLNEEASGEYKHEKRKY